VPEADTNILVEGEAERDHRIGIRVFLMGYWLTYELSQRKKNTCSSVRWPASRQCLY